MHRDRRVPDPHPPRAEVDLHLVSRRRLEAHRRPVPRAQFPAQAPDRPLHRPRAHHDRLLLRQLLAHHVRVAGVRLQALPQPRFQPGQLRSRPRPRPPAGEKRDQLEQVLPRGIAVGEGFVIDSYGGTSRQQDVIRYELYICPKFSINRTPQTTYYPCEGVIAVGEIKSRLDQDSVRDAFEKVASVKRLRRKPVHAFVPDRHTGEPISLGRNYLSPVGDPIVGLNAGRDNREGNEVFGFVLAGESRLAQEKLSETFSAVGAEIGERLSPNLLATLDGDVVNWGKIAKAERKEIHRLKSGTYGVAVHSDGPEGWKPTWSSATATHAGAYKVSDPFRLIVRWIRQRAERGRTSDIRSFDRYFEERPTGESRTVFCVPKSGATREGAPPGDGIDER